MTQGAFVRTLGRARIRKLVFLLFLISLSGGSCKLQPETNVYPIHRLHATAKQTVLPSYLSKVAHAEWKTHFIIGDFSDLYLFDHSTSLLQEIDVRYGGKFTPTDTYFDHLSNRIYIANFNGNNILVGTLDLETGALEIDSELGDSITITPEGVVAFSGYVAVANYGSSNVQVFSRAGAKWCEIPVFHAHGIAHVDGYLFATSLGDREVLKIDVEQCAIVDRAGSRGWARGQFMWPTGLASKKGEVTVSDAHTGMLTTLSADTLDVIDHWGGNGPGGFNMPYAVELHEGSTWVMSTFNRTVFQIQDRKVLRAWSRDTQEGLKSTGRWQADDAKYSADYLRNETVELRGTCYRLGYARLMECDDLDEFPDYPIRNTRGYNYFVHAVRGSDGGICLFSPESVFVLFRR